MQVLAEAAWARGCRKEKGPGQARCRDLGSGSQGEFRSPVRVRGKADPHSQADKPMCVHRTHNTEHRD